MALPREGLHALLLNAMKEAYESSVIEDPGIANFSDNVYFQAPSTISYPAIKYELSNADSRFANNHLYLYDKRYMITVIDTDPDSKIPDYISKLPQCSYDRHYIADNLHHDVFMMYY